MIKLLSLIEMLVCSGTDCDSFFFLINQLTPKKDKSAQWIFFMILEELNDNNLVRQNYNHFKITDNKLVIWSEMNLELLNDVRNLITAWYIMENFMSSESENLKRHSSSEKYSSEFRSGLESTTECSNLLPGRVFLGFWDEWSWGYSSNAVMRSK